MREVPKILLIVGYAIAVPFLARAPAIEHATAAASTLLAQFGATQRPLPAVARHWIKPGAAAPTPAALPHPPPSPLVDIRAFGDAGYIGGVGVFGVPPARWVEDNLIHLIPLRSPDVNFLNLEGALVRDCRHFIDKPFTFAVAPAALRQFIHWGFNLIGLANNHTLDCADPLPSQEIGPALAEAIPVGSAVGVHGLSPHYADLVRDPGILNIRGVKIGMIAIKAWSSGSKAAIGNLDNRRRLFTALKRADVNIRVLSLHGGLEGQRRPTDEITAIARDFVASYDGDIVFAHHPHRWQGVEVLRRANGRSGVVFYSLGNLLHNGLSVVGDGLAARVAVTQNGIDTSSLAVFPLQNSAFAPMPVRPAALHSLFTEFEASNLSIATRPPPKKVSRVPFVLEPTTSPSIGFRLIPVESTAHH